MIPCALSLLAAGPVPAGICGATSRQLIRANVTFPGVKPMGSWWVSQVGEWPYYWGGGLTNMTYGFKVKVGGREHWVGIGGDWGWESLHEEFPMSVDRQRDPHEAKLIDQAFLENHRRKDPLPPLFAPRKGAGPALLRVGGEGSFDLVNGEHRPDAFDWHKPVELIVIVWCTDPEVRSWERRALDWTRVPIDMQLVNYEGIDASGPTYDSSAHYVGLLCGPAAAPTLTNAPGKPSKPARLLDLSKDALQRWCLYARVYELSGGVTDKLYIYAAYFDGGRERHLSHLVAAAVGGRSTRPRKWGSDSGNLRAVRPPVNF